MPLPRFERLAPERRRVILNAAAAEFAEHGFRGASYNGIIAAAGVSKGAMYYYFDDKADLFLAVVTDALGGMGAAMGQLPEVDSAEGFWQAVEAMFSRVWVWLEGDERALLLGRALAIAIESGDVPRDASGLMDAMYAGTERFVALGQRVGAVRTDLPQELLVRLCLSLGQAADGWLATRLDTLSPAEVQTYLLLTLDLFQRLGRPER